MRGASRNFHAIELYLAIGWNAAGCPVLAYTALEWHVALVLLGAFFSLACSAVPWAATCVLPRGFRPSSIPLTVETVANQGRSYKTRLFLLSYVTHNRQSSATSLKLSKTRGSREVRVDGSLMRMRLWKESFWGIVQQMVTSAIFIPCMTRAYPVPHFHFHHN